MANLVITDLQAKCQDQDILRGISLSTNPGETHAIMGPNGSGKSTTAYVLAGHPAYEVVGGKVEFDSQDLLALSPDQRSQAGLFLAFQYPIEVPGVKIETFLREAHKVRFAAQPEKLFAKALDFRKYLHGLADDLGVKRELLSRGLNEGFSGGEKKRLEILQMAVLEPKVAILDETDSGLDVDALRAVAEGVKLVQQRFNTTILIITHYQRILDYIKPNFVHLLIEGKVVKSGDDSLAKQVDAEGYQLKVK